MRAIGRLYYLTIAMAYAGVLGAAPAACGIVDGIERGLGDTLAKSLEATEGLWEPADAGALLAGLTQDLFPLRSRDFPYRLAVLDSFEVNALALPGGHIYLYRGLLAHASSVDEVAGVIAHEMGHQEDRDFQRVVGRQLLWLSLAGLLRRHSEGAADAALVAGVVNSLRHSRRQEAQADACAVRLCALAGYAPEALVDFFAGLKRQRVGWLERMFLTHPEPARRRALVAERTEMWLRGHPVLAERLCRRLYCRGRPAEAFGLLEACGKWPAHGQWTEALRPELKERVEELARLGPVRLPSPGASARLLWKAIEKVRKDARIRQALTIAQSIDPEVDDWRYVGALGRTVMALMRLERALDSAAEAAWRAERCSGTEVTDGIAKAVRAAGQLRRAGWMLAAVLAELVASGPGQPLGAVSSADLACVWGQVRLAERMIRRSEEAFSALLTRATAELARTFLQQMEYYQRSAEWMIEPLARCMGADDAESLIGGWRNRLQDTGQPTNNTCEDVYVLARLMLWQTKRETDRARQIVSRW